MAEQLRAQAQACEDRAESRALQVTNHSDCLAISWSGGREYRLALAFERASKRAEAKLKSAEQVSGRPLPAGVREAERKTVIKTCRQRYATKLDARYASEAYVFQKTSEVVPEVLERVAPGLGCEIGRVPLHHYYLISRDQPAVDEGEALTFTRWTLEAQTYGDHQSMIQALLARIYPGKCPMIIVDKKIKPYWPILWWTLLCVVLGAALLAAGVYVERSKWFNEMTGRFDALEDELQSIDTSLSELGARYGALEQRLAQQADSLNGSEELSAILRQLTALEQRFAARESGGEARWSERGLDSAPCSLSAFSETSAAPAYLFRAQIGAQGVRVFPYEVGTLSGGARRDAALALLDFDAEQPMSAAAFRQWAAPAFAQSQAQGCRHFVVLNETRQGDAETYARLRSAVEDNFYIYRAAP